MRKVFVLAMLLWPLAGFAQRHIAGIRVTIAPPALRFESPPPAPSPRHQWISGYWSWQGGRHVWISGHWVLAPGPNYIWEPARWENQGGVWTFYEGYWRPSDAPEPGYAYQPPAPPVQPEVVETAPPPPIVEIRPGIPFPGAVWIGGYWYWNGVRYVWTGGRWSAPPGGHVWEDHRWDRREDGRWERRPGHWHPVERRR